MENQETGNVINHVQNADHNNIQNIYRLINGLIDKINNKDFRKFIDDRIIDPIKESVQNKIRPYLYYLAILYLIVVVLIVIILYYVIRIYKSQTN